MHVCVLEVQSHSQSDVEMGRSDGRGRDSLKGSAWAQNGLLWHDVADGMLTPDRLHQLGRILILVVPMSQLSLQSAPPSENLALRSKSSTAAPPSSDVYDLLATQASDDTRRSSLKERNYLHPEGPMCTGAKGVDERVECEADCVFCTTGHLQHSLVAWLHRGLNRVPTLQDYHLGLQDCCTIAADRTLIARELLLLAFVATLPIPVRATAPEQALRSDHRSMRVARRDSNRVEVLETLDQLQCVSVCQVAMTQLSSLVAMLVAATCINLPRKGESNSVM